MQCEDNLHVLMARVEGGKNTLQRAVATGDVKAHYEKSDIEGQKLVMDFEAVKKGVGKIQNRPATFEITGGVTVRTMDAKDPRNNSVVKADRIHANVINQTAELYGNPAVMVQDLKKVTGNKIRVVAGDHQVGSARVRELLSARVVGAGTADFPNDRDPLSGTRFTEPKLTHVAWAQSMNYDGAANTVDVIGDVHLDSELDKMRCQTVHLDFDRTAKTSEASPEEASTEPAAGKSLALGIGKFGTRQLAKIDAEGKVKVDSRSTDKDGHLIQLLDLNCANLIYTAKEKTMIVDGVGNMLVGDFRQPPPAKKAVAAENDVTPPMEDVQRPSASAFEWQKRMTLTQHDDGERTVQLEGDVVLVHRSGLQVELTDQQKKQWSVADWHDLRPGRHIVLGCDTLAAAFDKPTDKGKVVADPMQQGPRVGNLRNFQALKDVNLKDGQFQVLGQRLIYDVKDTDGKMVDVVKIFGYMEGQKKTLAQIISANPQTGRMQQQQAPEITWNRKDNSIETTDVSAVGGR
jgi:lipopolysaccharide export system protein LptA